MSQLVHWAATARQGAPAHVAVTGVHGFIGNRVLMDGLEQFSDAIRWTGVDMAGTHQRATAKAAQDLPESRYEFLEHRSFLEAFESGQCRPNAVLHNGACSTTTETDPQIFEDLNLGYSIRLWRACVRWQVPLIYASSASVYGDGRMGFDDDPAQTTKFQALNLYGRSKLEFDRFAIGASEAPPLWFGLRYFNVYGFDESHKGAQASMAFHGRNQLLTAGAVRLFRGDLSQGGSFGDGEQKRDFVAVEDIVRLTFLLLSVAMNPEQRAAMLQRLAAAVPRGMNAPSLESGTVLNAGTGHARSWNDLARSVANGCKRPSAIEYIDMPQSLRAHYQSFTQAEHTVAKRLGLEFDWTRLEVGVQNYMDRLAAGAGAAAGAAAGGGGADAMDHKDRLALVKDPDPRAATKKDTKS